MTEKTPYKIYKNPKLQDSSLVVGWSEDAAHLGSKVVEYLISKLSCQEFAEIEPEEFFPMGGVSVENDIAQFPESKFYCCAEKNLVIFSSSVPRTEWYKFLNSILDVAMNSCQVKEIYNIGGMVSLAAHTTPRDMIAMSNSPQMRTLMSQYDLTKDFDYETPPGQRPSLNSFLLWVAKRRNIVGASLWVPIPFYLLATEDPKACKKIVGFLNQRLGLTLDFADLDEEIARHNEKIARVISQFPELADLIHRLESNLSLTEAESNKLVEIMEEHLKKQDGA